MSYDPQEPRRLTVSGRGVPVVGHDIDTDRIIPARYLKCVTFEGLGDHAFQDERYAPDGSARQHPFNDPRYRGASVLVVNRNFGCGSSREHAPQSLMRADIDVVVGESFAEIFAGNCTVLGIPTATAEAADIEAVQELLAREPQTQIQVDLQGLQLTAGPLSCRLQMRDSARQALTTGTWDSTAQLLGSDSQIASTAAGLPYVSGF